MIVITLFYSRLHGILANQFFADDIPDVVWENIILFHPTTVRTWSELKATASYKFWRIEGVVDAAGNQPRAHWIRAKCICTSTSACCSTRIPNALVGGRPCYNFYSVTNYYILNIYICSTYESGTFCRSYILNAQSSRVAFCRRINVPRILCVHSHTS